MNEVNTFLFEFLHGFAGRGNVSDALIIFFATYVPFLVGAFFISSIWGMSRDWRIRFAGLGAAGIAIIIGRGILTESLHFFFTLPRPFVALGFEPLILQTSNAFPSGHAAILFALATLMVCEKKKYAVWFFVFALANGIARVIAGVHWPLDIVGGALVGVMAALIAYALLLPSVRELRRQSRT